MSPAKNHNLQEAMLIISDHKSVTGELMRPCALDTGWAVSFRNHAASSRTMSLPPSSLSEYPDVNTEPRC